MEKHRRCIFPTIPRQTIAIPQVHPHIRPPGHVHVRGPRVPAPPGTSVSPNSHTPAHEVRRASMQPGGGMGVRMQARLRTPFPPPGFITAVRTQQGGRVGFRGTVAPVREIVTECHGPARGRAGAGPAPVAGWLLRFGRSLELHNRSPVLFHVILLQKFLCGGGRLPDLHSPL